MWASSLVGPGQVFWMLGWPVGDGSHPTVGDGSHPTLVLFQHGSAPLPLQMAPQQGQDVLDSFFSQSGSPWWQGGWPP